MSEIAWTIEIGGLDRIDEISIIFQEVFEQTYPGLVDHHSLAKIRKMFIDAIEGGAQLRLAKVGGATAGFMLFNDEFLDQLYIRKQFQGHGIGRALVEHLIESGPSSLLLYTLASNVRAIDFYKSFGFNVVREGVSPDEGVPDVEMRWHRGNATDS